MDNLPEVLQHVIDYMLWSMDEEDRLAQEIILDDDDDDDENDNLLQRLQAGRDMNGILDVVVGPALVAEIFEMLDDEDELAIELIHGENDREIDWRRNLPRMAYMRGLEDPYFLQHFRMDRQVFEKLIVVLGHHLTEKNRLIRLRTEIDKSLMMAIWIIANLDTFRATGAVFGVSRSTVHANYLVVIEALRELASRYIKWPPREERQRISQILERRSGYRGIVRAIDGTLIATTAPKIQRERYIDRHQRYSLNVQAVCDHNLLFRDVYLGQPGSVHDCRVFQRSPLHDLFLDGDDLLSEGEHILGYGEYELTDKVHFNRIHSGIRMFVERSFGLLRGKMRRLLKLYIKRFVYCLDHVLSSFVLHNFIILRGEDAVRIQVGIRILPDQAPDPNRNYAEFEIHDEDEDEDEEIVQKPGVGAVNRNAARMDHPLLQRAKAAGERKRNEIADVLCAPV
ncbi:Protein ANTAGONIST OF LIKE HETEROCHROMATIN PROTEIN 1 [Frankliniella fusca]|uniref:Protein ANTAGONIST OF LIKE HETEROCHROMATIN PROTEIN 1 n=1 Tax=Frankliniella fusca TaxID=407009 RepID=A0AAE1HR68_9NEOP|nr:Protein ANTAGONIST OF LIKE HETEROCHROMATIN PROTEIN 1 [Frankliniella fusca]